MNNQKQLVNKDKLIVAAALLGFDILTADGYFVVSNFKPSVTKSALLLLPFLDNEDGYCAAIAFMREHMV